MFTGTDWITDWSKAEAFSLRIGEICASIPLRGTWEPNDRIAFAFASFRLAQEHHGSVHLLMRDGRSASANALARPLIEAALRTIWLAEDATDLQISGISKGRDSELPLLGRLNECFTKRAELPLSGKFQGFLHNFTHGGVAAMTSQFLTEDDRMRSDASIVSVVGYCLGGAGCTVASVLGLQDLLDQLTDALPDLD